MMTKRKVFRLSGHVVSVVAIILLLAFSKTTVKAQGGVNTVPSLHHAVNWADGDFDYFYATFKVPSIDAILPGPGDGACLNHPVWIRYPNGGWVEMGISKCVTDPPNKYHLYGFSQPVPNSPNWEWAPISDQLSLGQEVEVRIQKHPTDSSKWQIYVDNVLRWEPSDSIFSGETDGIDLGIEAQSPRYKSTAAAELNWIYVKGVGDIFPFLWPWWNYSGESETPERYYNSKNGGSPYRQKSWGYGLPSITNWGGQNDWYGGIGQKVRGKTLPWEVREGEHYSGISGIDEIYWRTAADGEQAIFAMGWHQGDKAEYLMEIPSNPFQLCIIALSDKPGPVLMNIYIDNVYIGQMSWAENDNNRHVWCKYFNVSGLKVPHVHTIGIEFANDYYYNPGYYDPNQDRNFYLDLLAITQ